MLRNHERWAWLTDGYYSRPTEVITNYTSQKARFVGAKA